MKFSINFDSTPLPDKLRAELIKNAGFDNVFCSVDIDFVNKIFISGLDFNATGNMVYNLAALKSFDKAVIVRNVALDLFA